MFWRVRTYFWSKRYSWYASPNTTYFQHPFPMVTQSTNQLFTMTMCMFGFQVKNYFWGKSNFAKGARPWLLLLFCFYLLDLHWNVPIIFLTSIQTCTMFSNKVREKMLGPKHVSIAHFLFAEMGKFSQFTSNIDSHSLAPVKWTSRCWKQEGADYKI